MAFVAASSGLSFNHDCGFREITSVKITAPIEGHNSDPASVANSVAGVEFTDGDQHLLQIGFDFEVHKKKQRCPRECCR